MKDASFGPASIQHTCVSGMQFYSVGKFLSSRFSHMSVLIARFYSLKDAPQSEILANINFFSFGGSSAI